MSEFNCFKENKDMNELNSKEWSEISSEYQDKFDKLMGDDKIQENKVKELETSEKISINQKFDDLLDKKVEYKELNSEEKSIDYENSLNKEESYKGLNSEEKSVESLDEEQIDNSRLPRNGGEWLEEPGNSEWNPDSKLVPGDRNGTNPDGKSWKELKEEFKFDTIPFKDGKPDFSEVARGRVEIDEFSDNRRKNFVQADEKLAEQKGCYPEEVKQWRKENKYTWHEEADCRTMLKVPSEVHGNIPHDGGISEIKNKKD